MIRILILCFITMIWPALTASVAVAQQESSAGERTADPETLRGQWERRGVTLGLGYTAEIFSAFRGGLAPGPGSEYLGSFVPTLTLNFSRIGLGRGEFYISAQSLHGHGINQTRVGAVQALSNLDERSFGRFIEAWYADSYRNGLIKVKAGRQYADAEFGVVENGADFLNSSYGLNPTTPMPTYPSPSWGASVWVAPASWISWGAGAYQGGTLDALEEGGNGMRRGAFVIFETKIEPFRKSSECHGSYRFGVWRQSRGAWLATTRNEMVAARNYGVYAAADHSFRRTPPGENRGPGLFLQWGWAPANRNQLAGYAGGGVAWAGLLPARPKDTAGFGVTRARLVGTGSESILEWFYKCRLTTKLSVQPDVQWVMRPSGEGRRVLVGGLRLGVEF